jgi:radical SAM protein with 4Fe4S-binding SPASM domain
VGTRVFDFNLKRAEREAARLGIEFVYFFQMPFPYKEQSPPEVRRGVRHGCPSAWRQLIVERDGNLKPCCYLDMSLGNTTEKPLSEQFNSRAAVGLRKTFTSGKYLEKCKGCGQFNEITDEQTEAILADARRRIESGHFSEGKRRELLAVLGEFEAKNAAAAQ